MGSQTGQRHVQTDPTGSLPACLPAIPEAEIGLWLHPNLQCPALSKDVTLFFNKVAFKEGEHMFHLAQDSPCCGDIFINNSHDHPEVPQFDVTAPWGNRVQQLLVVPTIPVACGCCPLLWDPSGTASFPSAFSGVVSLRAGALGTQCRAAKWKGHLRNSEIKAVFRSGSSGSVAARFLE